MIDLNDIIGGKLSPSAQKAASTLLFTWLAEKGRKAKVDDLQARLEQMRKDIEVMSKSLEFQIVDGRAVVKATGAGDATLRQLQNGTKWFDPIPNVNGMIVAAALSS